MAVMVEGLKKFWFAFIGITWLALFFLGVTIVRAATFGTTSTSGSEDITIAGYVQVSKANGTPASNGTLDSISVYCKSDGSGDTILVALYADSAGSPGAKLAEATTGAGAILNGSYSWVTVNLSYSLTAGTQYWLGWKVVSGAHIITYIYNTQSAEQEYINTSTFPNPWSGATSNDQRLAIYATYTPTAASKFPTPDMWWHPKYD